MYVCDGLDEAEPETAAGHPLTFRQAMKPLENALMLGRWHAPAIVADGANDPVPVPMQVDNNRYARTGVSDRVVDQVRKHLSQQFAVAENCDVRCNFRGERLSGVLRSWRKGIGNYDKYVA